MAYTYYKIDKNTIKIGDVIYYDCKEIRTWLLVKIMGLSKTSDNIEIMPLASDNSCTWVSPDLLYYTHN